MHTDKQSGRQQVGADLSIVLQDGVLNEVCKHRVFIIATFHLLAGIARVRHAVALDLHTYI